MALSSLELLYRIHSFVKKGGRLMQGEKKLAITFRSQILREGAFRDPFLEGKCHTHIFMPFFLFPFS